MANLDALMRETKLTLAKLRELHPDWEWTAIRDGFGWAYLGSGREWRTITVRWHGQVCGRTLWHVYPLGLPFGLWSDIVAG